MQRVVIWRRVLSSMAYVSHTIVTEYQGSNHRAASATSLPVACDCAPAGREADFDSQFVQCQPTQGRAIRTPRSRRTVFSTRHAPAYD